MWISARAAADLLAAVVSGDAQARAVLASGLAGPPLEGSRVALYRESAVRALTARPTVDLASVTGSAQVTEACPHGLVIARLPRSQRLDLTVPWSEAVRSVATVPTMPPITAGLLETRIRAWGRLPWVVTLCSYVVLGGDVTGTRYADIPRAEAHAAGTRELVVEPPGTWFSALAGCRLPTGPGGRPWLVRLPPPL